MTGKLLPKVHWVRENINSGHEQRTYLEAYVLGDFLDDDDDESSETAEFTRANTSKDINDSSAPRIKRTMKSHTE